MKNSDRKTRAEALLAKLERTSPRSPLRVPGKMPSWIAAAVMGAGLSLASPSCHVIDKDDPIEENCYDYASCDYDGYHEILVNITWEGGTPSNAFSRMEVTFDGEKGYENLWENSAGESYTYAYWGSSYDELIAGGVEVCITDTLGEYQTTCKTVNGDIEGLIIDLHMEFEVK